MEYSIEDLLDEEEKGKKLTEIDKQIIRMRASGISVRDIARRLRKSASTICDVNKRYFKEISDIRNTELAELQKRIYKQKQYRLDFLNQQFLIIQERLSHSEVIMKYENMVELAIKLSDSLTKCEREMQITDFPADNNSVTCNNPVTGVTEKSEAETTENKEVKAEEKQICNKVTDSPRYKSTKAKKSNSASAPRTRADFWLQYSKNKPKPPA